MSSVVSRVYENTLFFCRSINLSHVSITNTRQASNSWSEGVLSLSTGAQEGSVSMVEGRLPLYINQEDQPIVTMNAAFAVPAEGLLQLIGIGDSEAGVFVGYRGTEYGVLHRHRGRRQQYAVQITAGCTVSGVLKLTLGCTAFDIPVAEGMTPVQIMRAIEAHQPIIDANMTVFVGFFSLTVSHIHSEECEEDTNVDANGTGVEALADLFIVGSPPVDTWIMQDNFSAISRYTVADLDHTQMNVFRFIFSRWSTGAITFSMLDSRSNNFTEVHQWNNIQFNTSIPYKPTVLIQNRACTTGHTLHTSMATISSGTPSTCTNTTHFSKAFSVDFVDLVKDQETVLFVLNTPILISSSHIVNRLTACINSLTIAVETSGPLRVRIFYSPYMNTLVSTEEHAPWSCVRHGLAPAGAVALYGLQLSSTYVTSASGVQRVALQQVWCTPGSNICITASAVKQPVTVSCDMQCEWDEV